MFFLCVKSWIPRVGGDLSQKPAAAPPPTWYFGDRCQHMAGDRQGGGAGSRLGLPVPTLMHFQPGQMEQHAGKWRQKAGCRGAAPPPGGLACAGEDGGQRAGLIPPKSARPMPRRGLARSLSLLSPLQYAAHTKRRNSVARIRVPAVESIRFSRRVWNRSQLQGNWNIFSSIESSRQGPSDATKTFLFGQGRGRFLKPFMDVNRLCARDIFSP